MGCLISKGRNDLNIVPLNLTNIENDDMVKELNCIPGGDAVRQKCAVHFAVHDIYAYAPVHVTLMDHPKSSPKRGEQYIWIMLDEKMLKKCY